MFMNNNGIGKYKYFSCNSVRCKLRIMVPPFRKHGRVLQYHDTWKSQVSVSGAMGDFLYFVRMQGLKIKKDLRMEAFK